MNRFDDPLKKHRKLMASITKPYSSLLASASLTSDPFKEQRKLMESISHPLHLAQASTTLMTTPFQNQLDSLVNPSMSLKSSSLLMSNPFKKHQELMDTIYNPLKSIQSSLSLMADPFKEQRKLMKSLSTPFNSITLISDPFKEQRKLIDSMTISSKSIFASMPLMSNTLKELHNTIDNNASLQLIKGIALNVQPNLMVDNGIVSLNSKHIAVEELQELTDQIIQKTSNSDLSSISDAIDHLTNEIKTQPDPWTKNVLMFFIYNLILLMFASIINPIANHYVTPYLNIDKRATAKELKQSVNSSFHNNVALNSLRYVSATALNVRTSASIKADAIGQLHFSSIIVLVEKNKNWSLVEWKSKDTDAFLRGWVFSRYLAKFN